MAVGRSRQKKSTNQKRRELVRIDNTKKVLDGLLEGKSARMMAGEYKLSINTIHELINEAIRSVPPLDVETYRATLIEQSQSIIAANWAKRGSPQNAKAIIAAQKMIGDITGAFAPKEIDVSGTIVTQAAGEELMAKLSRLAGDDPEIEVTVMPPELESNEAHGGQLGSDESGTTEDASKEPKP